MVVPAPVIANPAFVRAVNDRAKATCSEMMCDPPLPCHPHAEQAGEDLYVEFLRQTEARKEGQRGR